jgi:hypothetical protein
MARCHVSDLDGIGSISTLKEIYLAFNQISDISDLARLEELEILDLEGFDDCLNIGIQLMISIN